MRVRDLKEEDVKVGLRVKSLSRDMWGTVVKIEYDRDSSAWIQWDDKTEPTSGFFWNDCDCEVEENISRTGDKLNES